jgi:hypothetical protein
VVDTLLLKTQVAVVVDASDEISCIRGMLASVIRPCGSAPHEETSSDSLTASTTTTATTTATPTTATPTSDAIDQEVLQQPPTITTPRRRRASEKPINYKEPSLRKKLRKGDSIGFTDSM